MYFLSRDKGGYFFSISISLFYSETSTVTDDNTTKVHASSSQCIICLSGCISASNEDACQFLASLRKGSSPLLPSIITTQIKINTLWSSAQNAFKYSWWPQPYALQLCKTRKSLWPITCLILWSVQVFLTFFLGLVRAVCVYDIVPCIICVHVQQHTPCGFLFILSVHAGVYVRVLTHTHILMSVSSTMTQFLETILSLNMEFTGSVRIAGQWALEILLSVSVSKVLGF